MPNRVIRDWTTSEKVDKLTQGAETFFTRLMMKADDYGNYTANIKLINAALFPLKGYDPGKVEAWLKECIYLKLVKKYKVDGKEYINIPEFGQSLRRMKHTYPPPDGQVRTSDGQVTDKVPPESETNQNLETESEMNLNPKEKVEISLSDFEKLFDNIWLEQLQMVHRGKDIPQAIREAYMHLQTEKRLGRGEISDFKKCIQSFLSNKRPELNGHNGKTKAEIKDEEIKRKLKDA